MTQEGWAAVVTGRTWTIKGVRAERITISAPFGLGSISFVPNRAERQAAWALYVELQTRVAVQPFDREHGSLRAVLASLYSLFALTRQILREAGPDVAHDQKSFGPVAIDVLTKGLAPFLNRWHPALLEHEAVRSESVTALQHERAWDRFEMMVAELEEVQAEMRHYAAMLLAIAQAEDLLPLPSARPAGAVLLALLARVRRAFS